MPISPSVQALAVATLVLTTSLASASDVETYTDVATATAAGAASSPAPIDAAPPPKSRSPGLFRWFRSGEPKSATLEADGPRVAVPAVGLSAPLVAPLASSELVANALGLLGVTYRRGGDTPDSGFDCSGLVRYVFQSAVGRDLPRRAVEISKVGAKVDRDELKPGDLVFYNTLRSAFSHVGIYLGDNRFIHAPSKGSQVRIEDMTQKYWTTRFNGARRLAD